MGPLTESLQAELKAKRSPRAYASAAISEKLRLAVEARMFSENLDFATIGRQTGYDPSSVRRWLLQSRKRIRCEPGSPQGISLDGALKFANWLEAEEAEAPPVSQPQPYDNLGDDVAIAIMEIATARHITRHPAFLAEDIGISTEALQRIMAGDREDTEALKRLMAWMFAE
jgi:hypothetical protein